MRLLERGVALLAGLAGVLASVATVACLLLVGWSVVARYALGTPLPWIDKVVGWLVVALVLLAAPEAQRRFEHIGVDIAVKSIGPRLARLAHLAGAASVAVVAWILLEAGLESVAFSRLVDLQTDIEGIPAWWIQVLLPLGAGLLLVVAAAQAVALALGREPPHLPPPDRDLPRDPLASGE